MKIKKLKYCKLKTIKSVGIYCKFDFLQDEQVWKQRDKILLKIGFEAAILGIIVCITIYYWLKVIT